MKIINRRYRILDVIESDSTGEVYHAVDLMTRDRNVRLKLFTKEYSKSERIRKYIDDFLTWTTVNHPNICESYAFEILRSVDNKPVGRHQYFYTSEFYDKEERIDYKDLTRDEIYTAIFDLCRAVQYVHFRGMTYGYLNFDNVLFLRSEEGLKVKLHDFAFICQYKDISVYSPTQINTFMAPESIWYEEFNSSADMYSLGVLIYLIYYQGSADYDAIDRLDEVVGQNPLTNTLKKVTSNIVENRFSNIDSFTAQLAEQLRYDYKFSDAYAYNRLHHRIGLVGNEKITSSILKFAESRTSELSGPVGVRIMGDSGLGKSRLLYELEYLLNIYGYDVIRTEVTRHWKEPFAAFKPILSRIIFNEKLSWELIQKYGPELVKLFPELKTRWDVQPTPALSDEHEHLKMANRIFNFMSEYGTDRPFVLLIDNAEYLSVYEHTVIDFLTSVQKDIPILIICTHSVSSHEDWFTNEAIAKYQLNAFNYEEGAEFIRRMLGVTRSPIEFSALLTKTFEGNARRIEEMVRILFLEKRIYVDENHTWQFDLPGDIQQLEVSTTSEKWVESSLKGLSVEQRQVLEAVSVFNEPVGTMILDKMFDVFNIVSIGKVLNDMVDNGILIQKLGDWGYSYDFSGRLMRSHILNNIEADRKIRYHSVAAEILEDFYKDQGRHMSDQLIYHLIESQQKNRAVKYCVLAAEEMTKFNIYSQAIEFYEKALVLIDKYDPEVDAARLLNKTGWLYRLLGKTKESEKMYKKALEISEAMKNDISCIDSIINLADISVLRGELSGPVKLLTDALAKSREIQYLDGELGAMKYLIKLWTRTGEYEKITEDLPKFIELSIDNNMPHFTGSFYNEYGIYKAKTGKFVEAENYFKIALESFRSDGDRFEEAKAYNNMGVLYGDGFGNVDISRQYYLKALSITNDLNILAERPIYLHNIGESYLREDRFEEALKYLNKALRAAEEIDSRMDIYSALPLLCETYIKMNNYERAYGILKKMDSEFPQSSDDSKDLHSYYMVSVLFYIHIKNFEKAELILNNYLDISAVYDDILIAVIETLRFRIDWHKNNFLKLNKSIEIDGLEKMVEKVDNYQIAHVMRNLLLDLSLELSNSKKYIHVKMLLDLDEKLTVQFDSEVLRWKRKTLEAVLGEKRTVSISKLLKDKQLSMNREWKWFAFKLLADEYFYDGDSYMALTNYLMALDLIKSLTFSIPDGHRENYLLYDESKIELKAKINAIRRKIDSQRSSDEKLLMHELETLSVEDYFDLTAIQTLYYNDTFLEKIYKIYNEKYSLNLSTLDDLIYQLKQDERQNIRFTLIHCLQTAIADNGCVYITDSNSKISEVVSSDDSFITPDINRLISQLGPEREGILINGFEGNGLSYLLGEHQKAIMLIPIIAQDTHSMKRRRNDDYDEEILQGYLYLESNQVFNRFSPVIFKKLQRLISMLSLLIDNLNIKKVSSIDELTGVYLRKYIEDKFAAELIQTRQNSGRLSVIMCDIDKFKMINDRYGHRKGDDILKLMGHHLKMSLRDTDLVGRYGGEEFIIVLPNTDEDEAYIVSEKIRQTIESSVSLNEDEPITLSLGVATYPDHGLNEEEIIEKADQALYHSKNTGRNRTTLWNAHIGEEKSRFDKLAGILTGNISNDTRNIQAMVDIMDLLRTSKSKEDKLFSVLTTLIDITQATRGAVLEIEGSEIKHVYAREKGYDDWQPIELDMDLIEMYMDRDDGDYFINWNKVAEINSLGGKPNWKSIIVMPLREGQITRGMILLSVPISIKEFDFSAFNFVDSVSGVVMKIIG